MKNQELYHPKKARKLLDQVRDVMRLRHYAFRTELTYSSWIKRFILFHDKRHPKDMGELEVEAFLTWLAVDKKVSKSTQNQAFNALIFLYRDVLKHPLEGRINAARSRKKQPACCHEQRGDPAGADGHEWRYSAYGQTPLWQRASIDGMYSLEGERYRI
ncbi:MAG: hypothetical protein DRP14_04805 [Candidatus Aenigmatarchaeota archaeon]|nr:MAG: hypothetical protein DRP14_04805 [Candidatus Aenigmarchaeota archaeon]